MEADSVQGVDSGEWVELDCDAIIFAHQSTLTKRRLVSDGRTCVGYNGLNRQMLRAIDVEGEERVEEMVYSSDSRARRDFFEPYFVN